LKWENGENEREGKERRKAGRNCLAGKILKSLPHEEEGRCQLCCKLRELLAPIQR